jgi:membrane protein implicated in regulation of membrane protease activity
MANRPKWPLVVRGLLSGALLVGVYSETGKWTALAVFLVLASSEVFGELLRSQRRSGHDLEALVGRVEALVEGLRRERREGLKPQEEREGRRP